MRMSFFKKETNKIFKVTKRNILTSVSLFACVLLFSCQETPRRNPVATKKPDGGTTNPLTKGGDNTQPGGGTLPQTSAADPNTNQNQNQGDANAAKTVECTVQTKSGGPLKVRSEPVYHPTDKNKGVNVIGEIANGEKFTKIESNSSGWIKGKFKLGGEDKTGWACDSCKEGSGDMVSCSDGLNLLEERTPENPDAKPNSDGSWG
jgi:hypothetical protein